MRSLEILVRRIPFFYGWVIVGCAMCANFSRQGAAVATLSIFAVPMTAEFDWSRTAFSGAVSLGGLLGAIISPKVGVFVDRRIVSSAAVSVSVCLQRARGLECQFVQLPVVRGA